MCKRKKERQNRKENTGTYSHNAPVLESLLGKRVSITARITERWMKLKQRGRRGTCRAHSIMRGWSRQKIFNSIIIEVLKVNIL